MFVYYTSMRDGSLVMTNIYKGTDSIYKVGIEKRKRWSGF